MSKVEKRKGEKREETKECERAKDQEKKIGKREISVFAKKQNKKMEK